MYIRRKVFSIAYDEATGEEKLFSTTEIMSEESYLEKLYSESEPEQKEFNSKAAKERNAKFFENKGKERLKKSVNEGTLNGEGMSNYLTDKENKINGNRVNSKINKLRKSWLNSDYKGYDKAKKAYKEAEKFEVRYGEQPVNEVYKKLGVAKKNLTTGDVFKNVGRQALNEEAQEIANKQKSKISRGAILTKKLLKELK